MGGVPWTKEEDHLLKTCILQYGEGNWHRLPLLSGLKRCRKSCRLRWLNYLRPNIKRGNFTDEEVQLIIRLHKLLGNRWTIIAGRLPGRTANDVKNYWNCHLSKKLSNGEGEEKQRRGREMQQATEGGAPALMADEQEVEGDMMNISQSHKEEGNDGEEVTMTEFEFEEVKPSNSSPTLWDPKWDDFLLDLDLI